jgi:AraC-like DNA-binding protein
MGELSKNSLATKRLLTSGEGWSACDVVCRAGPKDAAFEEQHAWISVSAVLSGTFVYRSSRARVLMAPGSLLLGEQGAPFCCSHEHGTGDRCVAFYFDPPLIEELAYQIPGVKRTGFRVNRIPPIEALAPLFADVYALSDDGAVDAGEELALRMAGAALSLSVGVSNTQVRGRDEKRVSVALRIINQRIADSLSVGAIASEVEMSRYHFLRTFHRITGETPYRYILNRRLILAAERLRNTSEGVLEVALECGFGDLSEFARRFKKRFGVTPAAYRQQPPSKWGASVLRTFDS